jgi:hypothetical protein
MKVVVTNKQLQFFKEYGWTKDSVSKLLISKYIRVIEVKNYYVADDVTQHHIFTPNLLNHQLNGNYDLSWYIRR